MLAHLFNGWQVDQAILSEEDRVVVSRIFYLYVYLIRIGMDFESNYLLSFYKFKLKIYILYKIFFLANFEFYNFFCYC